MSKIIFDVDLFREEFEAYSNETDYPDSKLQAFFNAATCYVSDCDSGRLKGNCRLQALNLMTAHLIYISDLAATGRPSYLLTAATIDNVTVSVQPPPMTSQWEWWLSTSPYGPQLLALLSSSSVGGFYVGGRPERSAFRKVGGLF